MCVKNVLYICVKNILIFTVHINLALCKTCANGALQRCPLTGTVDVLICAYAYSS